ncbi:MAG: NUDIX domain-containing protein [Candidatus Moranbacteria bacterium]|nr:NUDIX domain-containing protein [Candidatus Moranbacteria bacterium]
MKKSFDLKKGVDFIGVTCVFLCHDGQGNFLMHRRSKNCRDEIGKWDTGSGSMEFGETPEQAVTREIEEEYCVKPKKLQFAGIRNALRVNQHQEPTHWVALLFVAQVDSKKVRIGEPDKMEELRWFRMNELPKPLHSAFHDQVKTIKKFGVEI